VLTIPQAVERLIALVSASDLPHQQPLLATLSAALASLRRGNPLAAANQLHAFQNKVRAQVWPSAPNLALELIQGAGQVIAALGGEGASSLAGKLKPLERQSNGKMRLQFSGSTGLVYLVEASTNLTDWEKIGIASVREEGAFEFEDAEAARFSSRFYRICLP
jgi:hypothetical protein